MNADPVAPKVSLVELLAQANVKPEQIKYVGIRHYHGDQIDAFPKATLLIANDDWEILSGPKLPYRPPGDTVNSEPFMN
jgi:N-acyl homoserine lactone hydrolase